jgi:PAS domain S-box-containing protein
MKDDSDKAQLFWRPLPMAATLRQTAHSKPARVLIGLWIALTAACVALGIYQVKLGWSAIPVDLGPLNFSLTIYPPLILCVWMMFWLGFEWAFLSAYLATFILSLYSGMPVGAAILFALVDPLALAIYGLAYRTARMPWDLRGPVSVAWFVFVSFIAAIAGSSGSFVWSGSHGLSALDTFAIWQGWWIGGFVQAVLINAPVMALAGPLVERIKLRYFEAPPRPEPSLRWLLAAIAAGGVIVGGFLLASGELARMRLDLALSEIPEAARRDVLDATQSWSLMVWTGLALTLAGSLGGMFLAYGWNRSLSSEVKLRTAELHESEQRFRVTFDQAAVGIAHVAPGGRFLRVNRKLCEILGYSQDELVRRTFMEITHPEDLEPDFKQARRVLAGEIETFSMDKRYIRKNGTPVWCNLTVSLARGPNDEARYFISIVEDISARKHLEEQLLHSQKMEAIGRLAGGVAHDFNNLLTVIGGYGRMLLADVEDNEDLRLKAEAICQASDRAAELTQRLLAFSRRQIAQMKVIDLNDLVSGMEKILRRLLGEDVRVITSLCGSEAKVKVDPGQMEQVIVNLAVNARDAMPREGGTLELAVSCEPDGVTLLIRDDGSGMSDEVKSHLFEPFFTTKAKGKGTGLGLSIVYGIVKQSGGSIDVQSEVGKGTTFRIHLPAVREPDAPVAITGAEPASPKGSETILLVEDEAALRDLAVRVLRSGGYDVIEAGSGEAALDALRDSPRRIDLLVTDMIMPGMNGRMLAEKLRGAAPDLKVLYISGYIENAIELAGALGPATHFLPKPFAPSDLAQKVRETLDSRD